MSRLRATPRGNPPPLPRPRGRPPDEPKTSLALWLRGRGITVSAFSLKLVEIAPSLEIRAEDAPDLKRLGKIARGRHWPSAPAMLLIRTATEGAIDLEHWVRDLYA